MDLIFEKSKEKYDPFSDNDIVISFPESAFYDDNDARVSNKGQVTKVPEVVGTRESRTASKEKISSRKEDQWRSWIFKITFSPLLPVS